MLSIGRQLSVQCTPQSHQPQLRRNGAVTSEGCRAETDSARDWKMYVYYNGRGGISARDKIIAKLKMLKYFIFKCLKLATEKIIPFFCI
jgi:hypothetical protein